MNTATTLLHDLRGQQLRALGNIGYSQLDRADFYRIDFFIKLCGAQCDTRNLSDKSLEEIDTLALRYLDRVR